MRQLLRRMSLGSRLALLLSIALLILLMGFAWGLSLTSERALRQQTLSAMQEQTAQLSQTLALFDQTLQQEAQNFLGVFESDQLEPPFELDSSERVPVGDEWAPRLSDRIGSLNQLGIARIDDFTELTGMPVTIFASRGDDFVRVATSLKDERGERAMGTLLDRSSRAWRALSAGESYSGIARLFGTPYITRYEPMTNSAGEVVGASFIGVDISDNLQAFNERVAQMRVGESGFFTLFDARSGEVVAGTNPVDTPPTELRDEEGQTVLAPLFEQPRGLLEYEPAGGERGALTTWFSAYPQWNWVVAATAVDSDVDRLVSAARNRFMLIAVVVALLAGGAIYWLLRRTISRPLAEAQTMAGHLAEGDLGYRLETRRGDEIGALITSMNGISDGLQGIVTRVRESVASIGSASSEIASGNLDLSSRTENQAASLEESAASLEQLTATVRHNDERTLRGREMTAGVLESAQQSQQRLADATVTMADLEKTSAQIAEIIGTIDGIAFQTNLLALNASVEAARAGVHGRGFSVVADEVRALANRCSEASGSIGKLVRHTTGGVEEGGRRIRECGGQIDDIVGRVEKLNAMMEEIGAASAEQLAGIEQINTALNSLEQTTQNNAALVEQASASASQLDEQSGQLSDIVKVFRLPDRRSPSLPG